MEDIIIQFINQSVHLAFAKDVLMYDISKYVIKYLFGIKKSISIYSFCYRKQLEEKNKTIKKLKDEKNCLVARRNVQQEIRQLKTFLSDKISSINQMKEELKYKDIDSNTIAGVRNVNDLGKTFNYTSFCRVFCNK